MPAIVSHANNSGDVTSKWFDFYADGVNYAKEQLVQFDVYDLRCRFVDIEDMPLLEDCKPTRSEMVDHWVWYMVERWDVDYAAAYYSVILSAPWYRSNERYSILHEMLGAGYQEGYVYDTWSNQWVDPSTFQIRETHDTMEEWIKAGRP